MLRRSIPQYEVMRHAVAELAKRYVKSKPDVLDRNFVELYYEFKRASGYTREEIERKRLSLEGVLVPVTSGWNEELLKTVGFKQVDCFWRLMNFACWIAIKT